MGKIFFLMGKSASGKDSMYSEILSDERLGLKPYVGFTTRPIRTGETNGVEYFFTTKEELDAYEKEGKLIESRVYHTVYGDWYYYSVDSDNVDLDANDYLYIGTLESYVKMRNYYGAEKVVPLYVEVEDGIRLERAIQRERMQEKPGYEEMCRRFLGDAKDFSEENILAAGIQKRFENIDMQECMQKIKEEILCHKQKN